MTSFRALSASPLSDKRLQLWAVQDTTIADTNIWSCWKQSTDPNSAWTDWQVFPDPGSCHDLAAARLADGRLALFVIDEHDKILICYKTTTDPNSAWSGWRDLFPISP